MSTRTKRIGLLLASILVLVMPLAALASDGDLKWRGVLDSRPSPGLAGTWVIGGRSFEADDSIEIEEEHGALVVGTCTKVEYYTSGSANVATKIESQESYKCDGSGDPGEHPVQYAIVDSFPGGLIGTWVIGGETYTTDANTRFESEDGPFTVGGCVEVEYISGSNLVLELETEDYYKCSSGGSTEPGISYSQIYGVLDAFPLELIGTWTVSDVDYAADVDTRFEQEHGPFFEGGCVEIKYETDTNNAVEIGTAEPYKCSGDGGGGTDPIESKFYGLINAIPAGYLGTWTIGNGFFISTSTTELEEEHGDFAVGVCAEVEYYQDAGGDHVATEIGTEEAYKCNTNTYTNEAYGIVASFPPDLYGSWAIAHGGAHAEIYNASLATQFEQSHGTFAAGVCVKVKYYVEEGVNHAVEIETEEGDHCGGEGTPTLPGDSKVYATIDSFPAAPYIGVWQIGGVAYEATAATEFEQEQGAFAVGACVKARYTTTGGVNVLNKVETEADYKCQDQEAIDPEFKGYGVVESFPSGLIGTWQVSGIVYEANSSTRFEQEHGFFVLGAYVEVEYVTDGITNTAISIETHVAPNAGLRTIVGTLGAHTSSDDWADWMVDGVAYTADHAIEVGSGIHSPVVNRSVWLNIYRGSDGTIYVTSATLAHQTFLPVVLR
jgi:hypothetical protein